MKEGALNLGKEIYREARSSGSGMHPLVSRYDDRLCESARMVVSLFQVLGCGH